MPTFATPSPQSAETFRTLGHHLVDLLADGMARAQDRQGPVLPWKTPEDQLAAWPSDFPTEGGASPLALLDRVIRESNQLHHPRYLGHQVTAPLPLAALCDLAAATLNNAMAVYEMGPVATALEQHVVRFLAGAAGFDPLHADGIFTSGGSAGNLTALLAARQAMSPFDAWAEGQGGRELCFVCADQTHYSVQRAARIMGLGARGCVTVPTDDAFRLRPEALEPVLDRLAGEGRHVLAVVGSAGSTSTGAIDPLDELAEVCGSRGHWFHVDGAHGGAGILSPTLKARLKGIERADSLVIDAHKMLLMPALATAVLFRDGRHSFATFDQQAAYIFGRDARETWHDLAQRTLECTKRMIALKLYVALQTYGPAHFGRYQEAMHGLARDFAAEIRRRPRWELATEPDLNIVCFRYLACGTDDLDAFQVRARLALRDEGSFYLVQTRLRDRTWLRVTILNPATEARDLTALLDRIEALA